MRLIVGAMLSDFSYIFSSLFFDLPLMISPHSFFFFSGGGEGGALLGGGGRV